MKSINNIDIFQDKITRGQMCWNFITLRIQQ